MVLLKRFGRVLATPMGRQESEDDSARVPVVHPQLNVSVDHFNSNRAHTDNTYRPLETEKMAYGTSPTIHFSDLLGSVAFTDTG